MRRNTIVQCLLRNRWFVSSNRNSFNWKANYNCKKIRWQSWTSRCCCWDNTRKGFRQTSGCALNNLSHNETSWFTSNRAIAISSISWPLKGNVGNSPKGTGSKARSLTCLNSNLRSRSKIISTLSEDSRKNYRTPDEVMLHWWAPTPVWRSSMKPCVASSDSLTKSRRSFRRRTAMPTGLRTSWTQCDQTSTTCAHSSKCKS